MTHLDALPERIWIEENGGRCARGASRPTQVATWLC